SRSTPGEPRALAIIRRPPDGVEAGPDRVVSQFETMATQSPPMHRAGGAGGALGNPIGLSGPPPAGRLPARLSRRTTTGFPRPTRLSRPANGQSGFELRHYRSPRTA